jgi:hypothetical protein
MFHRLSPCVTAWLVSSWPSTGPSPLGPSAGLPTWVVNEKARSRSRSRTSTRRTCFLRPAWREEWENTATPAGRERASLDQELHRNGAVRGFRAAPVYGPASTIYKSAASASPFPLGEAASVGVEQVSLVIEETCRLSFSVSPLPY